MVSEKRILTEGKRVLKLEADAVLNLAKRLDSSFVQAVKLILACTGKVVVTGCGKSGHIGRKIAATLASTGAPAFFMHSDEALHGDLGVVTSEDIVLAISNSGETSEVLGLLPRIEAIGSKTIAITTQPHSTLATSCSIVLDIGVTEEADRLGLAPTTSSTVTLALGDALAIVTSVLRGFRREDFAKLHPGGSLGKKLKNER